MTRDTILSFPCIYPVKAVARHADDPKHLVCTLISAHVPEADIVGVESRPSSGGRYLAVTVTLRASSQAQLDALYRDLSADKRLLWVI
ncbi:YbeD family protein [Candidatus Macondimonas diazotrophica]|jgi:hypothetical protein|uniref:DUF493 domain-containing protein n=1 Tax=Candidatus Macondimonas diazotrophica TaxID=2305248 RepID=A0A4Z0F6Y0_9GAMM|nr:DUF493 domain-containing protein [Candidatus Macondimonas diazotrophica]NCU01335.1 DUF493 domain-containing protein [Candidatus Macondimonas diazotrophica]TFZ82025.1 DUF493 domain-containing protein [Candidatus Macondimonas diazotrophica]HBG31393.1 DUF493 domain-containing protein [Gammaproteobacteria bacterium]